MIVKRFANECSQATPKSTASRRRGDTQPVGDTLKRRIPWLVKIAGIIGGCNRLVL
jgi:hypothetical protein